MHISRFLLIITLFLSTLFIVPTMLEAAPSSDCYENDNACVVYDVCHYRNGHRRCREVACDIDDYSCINDAIEDGGELIAWDFDEETPIHDPIWDTWYEDQQVIVRLDIENSDQSMSDLLHDIKHDYNLGWVDEILEERGIFLLSTENDGWNAAEELQEDPRILYAEPNVVGDPPQATKGNFIWVWGSAAEEANAPEYPKDLLQLDEAHEHSTGENVIVAVIDTGIDYTHPWFDHVLVDGYDFIDKDDCPQERVLTFPFLDNLVDNIDSAEETSCPDNTLDIFSPPDDSMHGHGTHVAGIINQVAPHAKIMPLRALDSTGVGNIVPVAQAILYAADHCVDVINLSVGTPYESHLLKDIIDEVDESYSERCDGRILTIVSAAGNKETDTPYYPAAYESVIAVTSNNPDNTFATGANYGDWVTLSAPGVDIYSAVPAAYSIDMQQPSECDDHHMDGDECDTANTTNSCVFGHTRYDGWSNKWIRGQCDFWSGTSMAAPFVAGSAALLRSVSDSADIRPLLVNTTTSLDGSALTGSGIVSPLQALTSPEIITPLQPPLHIAVSEVGATAGVDGTWLMLWAMVSLITVTTKVNVRFQW